MKKLIPYKFNKKKNDKLLLQKQRGQKPLFGFTIIELLIIIGILTILAAMSIPPFRYFQKKSNLTNSAEEIINTLRLARNNTLASRGGSQWGVKFSTSSTSQQYILFKGEDYSLRDPLEDRIYNIPEGIEIYELSLAGGKTEVVFDQVLGTTDYFGTASLKIEDDASSTRQIIIEKSGKILSTPDAIPSDASLVRDSRHIHFDYGRQINTSIEILTLTFFYNSSNVTKDILVSDNLEGGQIYWSGKVDVNGDIQEMKIHTHRLNDINFGTQFCIHRDRRYNDKALVIEISGDAGGNLISYTNDGQVSQGTSIYASKPDQQ